MPLPSFLQGLRERFTAKRANGVDAVPLTEADVEATRTRARRRLIGMLVLVGAGVLGFPWLFETKPRPMSQDIQVVQAGQAVDAPVVPTAGRASSGRVAVASVVEPAEKEVIEDHAPVVASAPQVVKPAVVPAPTSTKVASSGGPKVAAVTSETKKPEPKVVAEAKVLPKPKAESKPEPKVADKAGDKSADKSSARYVVQFGAFAEVKSAQDARMKVEKLGIKTYSQQIDTPDGKRIRVRIGPFADKVEADKAMATLRKAGLTGAVLTL
ncbi:MAG: SPOR domain-containing protein [Aquabacterium sp.]|uniref:SPOR domain-containing protein n=1 Tax=Aquabacterium sp. TaxID=1872578 RepID=UPI003BCCE692